MILIILLVATALRIYGLTAFSLSNDELSALARLQFDSFSEVMLYGVYPDFHPAGVQIFLYLWTAITGFSDFMVRLPFALAGVGAVYYMYRAGVHLFGVNAGLLCAASIAALQFPLLYSQLARPYSFGLLFVLFSFYHWSKIVFHKNEDQGNESDIKYTNYLLFVIGVVLCMYTHYFSMLQAGLISLAGLFFLRGKRLVYYLLSGLAIVLLYIPHIRIFIHQVSKGGIGGEGGWLGKPGSDFFRSYFEYSFNDSTAVIWMFAVITTGFLLVNRGKSGLNVKHLTTLALYLIPFAVGYYYSLYVNPVIQYSVLLFSFPFGLLFAFSFSSSGDPDRVSRIPVLLLLMGLVYSTVKESDYYNTPHFSEFRDIAVSADQIYDQHGQENVASVINIHDPYYIKHYQEEGERQKQFDLYRIQLKEEFRSFSKLVDDTDKPFFLYAFSNMLNDPVVEQVIRSKFPCLVNQKDYLNSGYRLYTTDSTVVCLNSGARVTLDPDHSGSETISKEKFMGERKFEVRDFLFPCTIEAIAEISARPSDKPVRLVVTYMKNDTTIIWAGEETERFGENDGSMHRVFVSLPMDSLPVKGGIFSSYIWNAGETEIRYKPISISIYTD